MPTASRVLQKTTADTGLIEKPALAPHFRFHALDDRQVFLVSESFNTLLHGEIYPLLLPLLDGQSSYQDIVRHLQGKLLESSIKQVLISLASKGYVVSGDYTMPKSTAAFWTAMGISPRFAEEKIASSQVLVPSHCKTLVKCLSAMGVVIAKNGSANPSLAIMSCEDYLDPQLAEINQQHIALGRPWMLVSACGLEPMFGPIFQPAEQSPCWACLAYRLRGHQEVHNFLRNYTDDNIALSPQAMAPVILEAVHSTAALEIVKWLVIGENAAIHRHALTIDISNLSIQQHRVSRRPQCQDCGDEAYGRIDRKPVPILLQPSPARINNSGGVRTVSSQDTLTKYRHLIDPVGGVVTWLRRTTKESDPWLHVHWSGSNHALKNRALSMLRISLRSKSAGKGSTSEQSETSALCEALERYSGAFHGEEIRCQKRYSDFNPDRSEAIHPNDVQLFSDSQLAHAQQINAAGHPYNVVPPRLDPEALIDWSPVWSLTRQQHLYLPTSLLYFGKSPDHQGATEFFADSNGCAAGNTLEEAILQGFFELVERDAFAIWWYNRLRMRQVDLASLDNEYLANADDYYRSLNRELWVLDITSDFQIPSFVAISRRIDKEAEDIIYGSGAHFCPHIAVLRAVCELNQCLHWAQGTGPGGTGYQVNDPQSLWWWQNIKIADHSYLTPSSADNCLASDYPSYQSEDLRDDVEKCRAMVEEKGLEFLVLDQTRPDIGMPVVRVVVPGMRHYWQRFAPGRLYDVPVHMGCLKQALDETTINTLPVIG